MIQEKEKELHLMNPGCVLLGIYLNFLTYLNLVQVVSGVIVSDDAGDDA